MKKVFLAIGATTFLLLWTSLVYAQSPCSTLTDPLEIVKCEQQRAGGSSGLENNSTALVTFLRQTAASLNAASVPGGPFGILVKTSGHNCHGYSCDIICSGQGNSQRQWDVLIAGGDPGGSYPSWELLRNITVRPCEFTASVPPTPTPIPPTVDLAPILARLAALEQDLSNTKTEAYNLRLELDEVRSLISSLPPATIACTDLPEYRGRGWFGSIMSKPVCR